MIISLRTVGSIGNYAFSNNKLSTATLPAGYSYLQIVLVVLPLLDGLIILVSVADLTSIRLTNLGSYAFTNNQLTSVTFLG